MQYGFRRGRSTASVLARFTDDVNEALDQRKQVVVIYIDFKKAFDTLEHHQLLQAVEECGVGGPLKQWLRAYFTNRQLRTVIDGVTGEPAHMCCGVPTGSVFGPVGYIMHVNSMCNVVQNCRIYMYADDTCLLYADKNLSVIESKIQEDFTQIIKWTHDNGIIMNINKTKCMHIRSPYLKNICSAPRIVGHSFQCLHSDQVACSCPEIEVVEEYKYLGLVIDYNFSWKVHITNLCSKLRSVLVKFHYLSYVLSRETLYTVYYALVDSLLSYGLVSYGRTFKTYLDKIKALQIRFMKLLVDTNTKRRCKLSNYEELFLECKMLPVHEKVVLWIAVEQYGCEEFKTYFTRTRPVRNRVYKVYDVPTSNNYFGERSRKYLVPKIFNDLPIDLIRNCLTKTSFKNAIQRFLLQSLC